MVHRTEANYGITTVNLPISFIRAFCVQVTGGFVAESFTSTTKANTCLVTVSGIAEFSIAYVKVQSGHTQFILCVGT